MKVNNPLYNIFKANKIQDGIYKCYVIEKGEEFPYQFFSSKHNDYMVVNGYGIQKIIKYMNDKKLLYDIIKERTITWYKIPLKYFKL